MFLEFCDVCYHEHLRYLLGVSVVCFKLTATVLVIYSTHAFVYLAIYIPTISIHPVSKSWFEGDLVRC